MPKHQSSEDGAEWMKLIRWEGEHVVFSLRPGREGRAISVEKAASILNELVSLKRDQRRFTRRVTWAATLIWATISICMIGLAVRGTALPIIMFFLPLATLSLVLMGLPSWQAFARHRRIRKLWKSLENMPPVRALTYHERVARGISLNARGWIFVIAVATLGILSKWHGEPGQKIFGNDTFHVNIVALLMLVFLLTIVGILWKRASVNRSLP